MSHSPRWRDRTAASTRSRARDPIFWNDVLQLVKTVAAAVLDLPQPFLAPWSALLVVHATVFRTFSQGARQVTATTVGVVLAWVVGVTLGLDTLSVALALLVGLTVGALAWFEGEGTTVAATALVVLATGFSTDDSMLVSRLADTAIGIVVGLLVNAAVWPPLRRRTATAAIDRVDDRVGRLLSRVAEELRAGAGEDEVTGWIEESRDIDGDIDTAWSTVRQAQESARMNPRRSARLLRQPQRWFDLLRRMEQAVAEARSMARTLGRALERGDRWDSEFAHDWSGLLAETGAAIEAADRDGLVVVRERLDGLVGRLERLDPIPERWPEYGALLLNLRNVVDTMDEVAAANPLDQPPPSIRVRANEPRHP
jgi:uncharacterized membrane protein YgaE (UPF0421/DUF939 family)